ncbi:GNAT family N-acetyltransferase [Tuwongella immobilis]|uniref:Ribosomal-protein-alanine acetyltransferase n=1 Tax=Tuwongella immobilis TaxID=692036 RepID=A0A6C2YN24_9BACT|nr:GNAT family N-acetyltransferase [Tuwongella immobilis]VIP02523.1 ribosomal-protein-alanine acetyltransferase : [Tuwongella immobilis]VTS01658.1 ribosomal-protein-alanine acetyltransferase : [Tuwongella immobilis]
MTRSSFVSWESLDSKDPILNQVKALYESTQVPDERIPWAWIQRVGDRRAKWRPGQWSPHLLIAASRDAAGNIGDPIGFIHGAHVPGLGGYICYLGVAPEARRLGVSAYLFEQMSRVLQATAGAENAPLELIVWESHRPRPDASREELDRWEARCRSFQRAGAFWIDGIVCHTPSFEEARGPVLLELFVLPQQLPRQGFTADKLRSIASTLLTRVYHLEPEHPWFAASLPADCEPRLRPAIEALQQPEIVVH